MTSRKDLLEKAEETEIKLPTSAGSLKKQESSRKTSISPRKYLINIGYFKNNLSIHLTNITAGSYSQLGQLLAEA